MTGHELDTTTVPLRRHMTVAVLAPVVLLLILGGVLGHQITKLVDASELVTHTNEVIAKLFETRMRMLEMESSLRGYLLGGDKAMLGGYEAAAVEVTNAAALELTRDNPQQQARLADLAASIQSWKLAAEAAIRGDIAVVRADYEGLQRRAQLLARARELLEAAVATEQELLRQRQRDNADTEHTSMFVFFGLLLLSAASIAVISRRELGAVSQAFRTLVAGERVARNASALQESIRSGEADVARAVVGERSIVEVANSALTTVVNHTGAVIGAVYHVRDRRLRRVAAHAMPATSNDTIDAGPLAQVVVDGKLRRIADADGQLETGTPAGKAQTVEIVIAPAKVHDQVVGVFELGFRDGVTDHTLELLHGIATPMALALRGAEQRERLQELLDATQRQGEELQTQHEELRVTNEELEHQGTALREASLRQQQIQHELEATNANLEEQTALLEQQREELQASQTALQERARELQLASQYKSEFLARMSHELRTPLNSSLILARLLGDNASGNLTDEQVRFANTIYSAGNDLLLLINDILDLAKIEAGRLELRIAPVQLPRVRETMLREFESVASSRGLALRVELASSLPTTIKSDEQRLIQILRNLISNACKFTDHGEVVLAITGTRDHIAFAVRDTGIGIPSEHLERVFEAFHQVDGTVSRKHGGTGLGLAISRDLAHLLGGTLTLESASGRGSVFTLAVPIEPPKPQPPVQGQSVTPRISVARTTVPAIASVAPPIAVASNVDDRDRLDPARRTFLIIDDDLSFARILIDLAHDLGYQALHAATAEDGIAMALRYLPDGILLDVQLPDHSGLTVLERLKRQPQLRHVPVHMISVDDHAQRALELGAVGYLMKPTNREHLIAAITRVEDRTAKRVRRILIVEDDAVQADALTHLLSGSGIEIIATDKISEALDRLSNTTFDCVVMDLRLTDGTGFDLLEKMTADHRITFPPVIVHTGKDLSAEEETKLRGYSSSIIVKGARSPDRLLDEVSLFLHQVEAEMPPDRQKILREVRSREAIFEHRTVLIVEDDVRNVFALSSILEPRGLKTVIARNGREALAALDQHHVDIVLMDIMMPEMDGLEATRRIRQRPDGKKLPIIALTAKAMADDRQASLDVGASDYLAKPIDIDMLLSLLRVWMPR